MYLLKKGFLTFYRMVFDRRERDLKVLTRINRNMYNVHLKIKDFTNSVAIRDLETTYRHLFESLSWIINTNDWCQNVE